MKAGGRFYFASFCLSAVWFSITAHAHTSDVLLSRLVFRDGADVTLEVTADVAGISWLRDAANPADSIGKALQIHLSDGRTWSASQLGKPVVTLHTGYPHPSPVPLLHSESEPTPELYTVSWNWRPSASPLRVEVAKGSGATTLLWTVPSGSNVPASGWQMLLEGEFSNPIALPFDPKPLQWNWKARMAAGIAAVGLGLQGCLILIRLRRLRRPSPAMQ